MIRRLRRLACARCLLRRASSSAALPSAASSDACRVPMPAARLALRNSRRVLPIAQASIRRSRRPAYSSRNSAHSRASPDGMPVFEDRERRGVQCGARSNHERTRDPHPHLDSVPVHGAPSSCDSIPLLRVFVSGHRMPATSSIQRRLHHRRRVERPVPDGVASMDPLGAHAPSAPILQRRASSTRVLASAARRKKLSYRHARPKPRSVRVSVRRRHDEPITDPGIFRPADGLPFVAAPCRALACWDAETGGMGDLRRSAIGP